MASVKSTNNAHAENEKLIKEEIIPNLVHDRFFCPPGSREFVELLSVKVEPCENTVDKYKCCIVLEFSGEPRTLYYTCDTKFSDDSDRQTERNKLHRMLIPRYPKLDIFPKYIVTEQPFTRDRVLVAEDAEELGLVCIAQRAWNKEEAEAIAKVLAKFHAEGMRLIKEDPELSWFDRACCNDMKTADGISSRDFEEFANEVLSEMKSTNKPAAEIEAFERFMSEIPGWKPSGKPELRTIVQGSVLRKKVALKQTFGQHGMRFVDWTEIELYGSCALDLSLLLFQTPCEGFDEVLDAYCDTLRAQAPEVPIEDLKDEVHTIGFVYAMYKNFRESRTPSFRVLEKFLSDEKF
ncbi:uncharacterized protein LOC106654712 [Trichogramma pretiosum]|uniref:uncharacterized protein LOC106654712 n=1 Tax=Trichogramma pretiosum TaxID=7493 RepID=UPI0006C986B0|nr:uncharacterized protein LOC106654712 [Trichogramma pretiosum]XP_014230195.1 uncharacterized protein LOC106654712 [Trichogramma pretiosum]